MRSSRGMGAISPAKLKQPKSASAFAGKAAAWNQAANKLTKANVLSKKDTLMPGKGFRRGGKTKSKK